MYYVWCIMLLPVVCVVSYCWAGAIAGANRDMAPIPANRAFLPNCGTFGLLANTSVAKRNSWNIFRLNGLRRDEYRNDKK